MSILDYICMEHCRICKSAIVSQRSIAKTVCDECWLPLIQQEAQLDACQVPDHGEIFVAYGAVYERTIKTLAYKLKYDDDRLIAHDLSQLLWKAFRKLESDVDEFTGVNLVPIPLSFWRKLKRGFNQAELLAQHLSKASNQKLESKILMRQKHTKAQHDLSREARRVNLTGAFRCRDSKASMPKNVVLIDDIHTSGATISEAARTLFEAGCKNVAAVTVARALLFDTRQRRVWHLVPPVQ